MIRTAIETAVTAVTAVTGTMFGSQVGTTIGAVTADVSATPLPEWFQLMIGPVGAVVGLIVALRWMTHRLDLQEKKYESREEERDNDRKMMIETLANSTVIMRDTRNAVENVTKIVTRCQERNLP